MKRFSKKFLVVLVVALCLMIGTVVLAACDEETVQEFTLTLDPGDGALAQTSLKVVKDELLLKKVADIAPKDEGVVFDCWLLNGNPVGAEDKMTGDITLTAQYKTAYKVEVYYQNEEKSNYVQDTTKTVAGYGKVGETLSPSIAGKDGFVLNDELSSDASKALAKGENLLRYYYARAEFTLTYVHVGEEAEERVEVPTYFGATETVADCSFERDGYAFIGWSDSFTSGADDAYAVGEDIEITKSVTLYAQWGKVYAEAYESGDSVAIAEIASKNGTTKARLFADGEVFDGQFDAQSKFFVANEIKGKVFDENGLFLYDTTGLYLGYSLLGGASDEAYGTLELDMATGSAVYSIDETEITGTYEDIMLSSGKFSGEMQFSSDDLEFYFCFLQADENSSLDTDTYVGEFFRRGEEAGEYVVVDVSSGSFEAPYVYTIVLDGYGELGFKINAMLGLVNAYGTYYGYDESTGEWSYEYEGQLFPDTVGQYPEYFNFKIGSLKSFAGSFADGDGELLTEIPILVIQDEYAMAYYENENGGVFESEGYGFATYTEDENSEPIEGYAKYLGLVTKEIDEEVVMLSIFQFSYDDVDGAATIKLACNASTGVTVIENEAGSYRREHYDEKCVDLVLDGTGYAELNVYFKEHDSVQKFAQGSYEMTSATDGVFHLEWATQSLAYLGVAAGDFSFRLVDGVTFEICDQTLFGEFDFDGATATFDGYGKIQALDKEYTFTEAENNILKAVDSAGAETLFIVDRVNRKLTKCGDDSLFGEYLTVVYDNALYIGPGKLFFDGFGNALFYEMENGELVGKGVYTFNKDTGKGNYVPVGESQFFAEAFEFIITEMADDEGVVQKVYIKYDAKKALNLTNGEQTLVLDGYDVAKYFDGETTVEKKFEITYNADEYGKQDGTGIIVFAETNDIFTFDVNDKSFEKVGNEYGTYYSLKIDEGGIKISEPIVKFDGKGNATIYELGLWDVLEEIGTATYAAKANSDNEWIITYTGGKQETVSLKRVPLVDGGYTDVLVVYNAAKAASYTSTVNGKTATVAIDAYGDLTFTDYDGNVYNIDFWAVEIASDYIAFESEELVDFPSRTVFAYINKANNTFTTSNEYGVFVRYYENDFYYPQLELWEEEGEKCGALYMVQSGNLILYTIGTYEKTGSDEYTFTAVQKGDAYADIQHIMGADDTLKFKLDYIEGFSVYIACDEHAEGEYTLDGVTYTLDGYGAVTTSDGKAGEAERINDIIIADIDGTTRYFAVGENNVLTEVEYYAYIEWII